MSAKPDKGRASLRGLTVSFAACVAAFVPAMQVLMDHVWPTLTKPVLVGLVLGAALCGLCLLPRHWHLRLFLMSLTGLMTIGLLEIGSSVLWGVNANSIYEWDDHCIYRLRPNSQKTFVRSSLNGGERIPISINSQGFRGPEFSPEPMPADARPRRVVVYGDSFIEAEYSAFEKTFPEQLRSELTGRLKANVDVINAGVIGYGPDQMLLRMESELPRLKPDCVVACFFADNDLGDLLRNKLFKLDDRGELQSHTWQLAPGCGHPGRRPPYEPMLWKWTRNALRGLQSRNSVTESYMDRWLRQCTDEYTEYIVQQDPYVRELQVDHYDADVSLTPNAQSSHYKARLFGKILERMKTVCRKNATQLFVVLIPSPADLIEDYDFCSIDQQRYPHYRPRAITNTMTHAAESLAVPFVNLFDAFAARDAKQLYFRGGDNHWNDQGQHEAAIVVAQALQVLLKSRH